MAHAPIVIDVAATALNADDRRRIVHPLVGGLILFARNWRDRRQLSEMCAEIHALRPDLLVCVDHEGGRVQRFRGDGFTHLPAMQRFGERWFDDGRDGPGSGALRACDAATAAGFVLGAELRACGVDFSFTPVLDLDHGTSTVIGDRAFARDPRIVTLLAKSLMHGLLQAGMAHCGKHFPGHGFAAADSHVDLPVDDRTLEAIVGDDARPYGWLRCALTAVMPAHVVYPAVDSRPAGFSAVWLQQVLRRRLGFDGAIFSDDLSMAGARRVDGREVGNVEAAQLALAAGCDLVLLCNQSLGGGAPLDELIDGLDAAARRGEWQPDASSEARRRRLLPRAPALRWDDLVADPVYRQARETIAAP